MKKNKNKIISLPPHPPPPHTQNNVGYDVKKVLRLAQRVQKLSGIELALNQRQY